MGSVSVIFLVSQGQLTRIVADGAPAPGGGVFALLVGIFPAPSLNDNGEVAFGASVRASPTGSPFSSFGVFLFVRGQLRKLVGLGDPSPLGGTFIGGILLFTLE